MQGPGVVEAVRNDGAVEWTCAVSTPRLLPSLDWAMPIERKLDSFGELVWLWIGDLERGLWVPDREGGWARTLPAWEEGFPDDIEARGIW
jgi:hypothetical protein